MSASDDIADYLAGLTPSLGTVAEDLFVDFLPETPPECGAVSLTGGSGPDFGFGVDGVQFEHPTVSVRFRAAGDDAAAHLKAQQAYLAAAKVQGRTLGSTYYLMLRPLQPPFKTVDEQGRTIWQFNILVDKKP